MSTVNDSFQQQNEDLVEFASSQPLSPNPLAQFSDITVSLPESVEVRLVDARILSDYEIWSLFTSILSTATVGFFVGSFQVTEGIKDFYRWNSLVFLLLTVIAGCTVCFKRRALTKKTKKLRFSVGEQLLTEEKK